MGCCHATLGEGRAMERHLPRSSAAPYTNDAQRANMKAQMQPKLQQIDASMANLRKATERGNADDGQRHLNYWTTPCRVDSGFNVIIEVH